MNIDNQTILSLKFLWRICSEIAKFKTNKIIKPSLFRFSKINKADEKIKSENISKRFMSAKIF